MKKDLFSRIEGRLYLRCVKRGIFSFTCAFARKSLEMPQFKDILSFLHCGTTDFINLFNDWIVHLNNYVCIPNIFIEIMTISKYYA